MVGIFTLDLFNAPIQSLLYLTKKFLNAQPNIEVFKNIWKIITYTISFFYGLLFAYVGFQFIFSGNDIIRREMAKQWLKNTLVMIVLIQASFYLYGLALELGTSLTSSTLSLTNFNLFNMNNINSVSVNLEFIFIPTFVFLLFFTMIFLSIRYIILSMGVILIPIAIFLYFIPPLRSYGKLIIGILGVFLFVSFFASLIILGSSMVANLPLYNNIKMLVMISCFLIIDLLFLILTWHVILKSAIPNKGDLALAINYITKLI